MSDRCATCDGNLKASLCTTPWLHLTTTTGTIAPTPAPQDERLGPHNHANAGYQPDCGWCVYLDTQAQIERVLAAKVLHIELIRHALELNMPELRRTIERLEEAKKVSAELLARRITR